MGHLSADGRDAELLTFIADHRLVLPSQLAALTGLAPGTIARRLRRLERGGFVRHVPLLRGFPAARVIRPAGLRALSRPPARGDFTRQMAVHDIGAGWLWLAARGGAFGSLRAVHTERQLRSADGLPQIAGRGSRPRGVRQFSVGPGGRERLHYPDLELETAAGRRVAVELELTGKSDRRLEHILAGYAADPSVDAVLYVVAEGRMEARIRRFAAQTGASRKLIVRHCSLSPEMARLATGMDHPVARTGARVSDRSRTVDREDGR